MGPPKLGGKQNGLPLQWQYAAECHSRESGNPGIARLDDDFFFTDRI
jgi:hypothetical protein